VIAIDALGSAAHDRWMLLAVRALAADSGVTGFGGRVGRDSDLFLGRGSTARYFT
jgi:hypothetical protein